MTEFLSILVIILLLATVDYFVIMTWKNFYRWSKINDYKKTILPHYLLVTTLATLPHILFFLEPYHWSLTVANVLLFIITVTFIIRLVRADKKYLNGNSK